MDTNEKQSGESPDALQTEKGTSPETSLEKKRKSYGFQLEAKEAEQLDYILKCTGYTMKRLFYEMLEVLQDKGYYKD